MVFLRAGRPKRDRPTTHPLQLHGGYFLSEMKAIVADQIAFGGVREVWSYRFYLLSFP
jgi:hypothetical protein